jgi:eukaryotic-like serine/threonine-protein kinase
MGFHVGQTFGDYSIIALAGAGGMGRVYKVQHVLTQRLEAMKVLSAEQASEAQIKRFEREMRALAKLSHPNIAALHNALHLENELILLMEYIDGATLETLFSAGRVPLENGVGYIKQVLAALEYAHRQGVVHRDVSPANIIVTTNGQAKLTDFGLAKSYGDSLVTNCGEILGSLPYMAPEQLKGKTQPDLRSDLYSVGAILYEHLTGQKPFGPHRRLAAAITDSESDPAAPSELEPGLAEEWDQVLRRALERDPARRFASAEEFLDAITRIEQPHAADLPLPRLRTLGVGVAIFAVLIAALMASPGFSALRSVAPVAAPWERLHIAPPPFAMDLTAPKQDNVPARPVPQPRPKVRAVAAVSSAALPQTVPVAATAEPQPDVAQSSTPEKHGFWHKLNPFKKTSR